MLSLFRTNQFLANFLLIFYVAILYVHDFVITSPWVPSRPGILAYSIYQWMPWDSVAADGTAAILVLLQGILVNFIVAENRLSTETTLFPGVFYILIASCLPEFTHLSPLHMANSFYLLAMVNLFSIYNSPKSAGAIFNIGFWIGVGSLFYFSFLIFMLVGFIGVSILRAFNFRERLMIITGAFIPYLLLGAYYFWFDQLPYFLHYQLQENLGWLSFFRGVSLGISGYLKIGFLFFLLLIALVSYNQNIARRVREIQKKVNIIYWMLLIPLFSIFFQAGIQLDHLLVLAIPVGILLSFRFAQLQPNWGELLHFFLLLIVLFFQYQSLILS